MTKIKINIFVTKKSRKIKYRIIKKMKSQNQNQKPVKRVRFQTRCWEVIFDTDVDTSMVKTKLEEFEKAKYGIYKAFGVYHNEGEDGKSHIHLGMILRDVPKTLYSDNLKEYFGTTQCSILGKKGKKKLTCDQKLQIYYNYCMDEDHPHHVNTTIESLLIKGDWTPSETVKQGSKIINVDEMTIKTWFLYKLKNNFSFREIVESASIDREAELYYSFDKYKRMFNTYVKFNKSETKYRTTEEFRPEVVEHIVSQWNPKKQTLILKGPSNKGKTELAKALLKNINKNINPIICSSKEKLRWRDPAQPILYDDMNFSKFSRSSTIHFLDIENDRDIRILRDVHTIEAGTPRIMTTNEELEIFMDNFDDPAIARRFLEIDVTPFGVLYHHDDDVDDSALAA